MYHRCVAHKKVIILDFSCSKFYTHNSSYIDSYGLFVQNNNLSNDIEYWISKAANNHVRFSGKAKIFKILRSPLYGYERRQNYLYWFFDRVINIFFERFVCKLPKFMSSLLIIMVSNLYMKGAISRVKILNSQGHKIMLILPAADALSIRFIQRCLEIGIEITSVSLRILNAEKRGIFRIENVGSFLSKLVIRFPSCTFSVGYEVDSVGKSLLNYQSLTESIYWAPLPVNKKLKPLQPNKVIRIGFIGSARKLKGFDLIPEILNRLDADGVPYKASVQLANKSWYGYEETLKKLNKKHPNINYLAAGLPLEKIIKSIRLLDLIIMPYDLQQYYQTGSGILYQASECFVPTISSSGVGFEWDIKSFKIGSTFNMIDEIAHLVNKENIKTWKKNLAQYNLARTQANLEFLKI